MKTGDLEGNKGVRGMTRGGGASAPEMRFEEPLIICERYYRETVIMRRRRTSFAARQSSFITAGG